MKLRVAFRQTAEERFLVITEAVDDGALGVRGSLAVTAFEHEDVFLRRMVEAELSERETVEVATAVLLAVSQPERPQVWVAVCVSEEQAGTMELLKTQPCGQVDAEFLADCLKTDLPFEAASNPAQFYEFLMQSPTPFVILAGPEYRFAFINPPYMQLVGRTRWDRLLGRTVLEAIPELAGQVCLQNLDTTYRTGQPQVRKEMLSRFRNDETGEMQEVYFDIVYHPVRNKAGEVSGIMAQATDVTERVLGRQVRDAREQQLYRQWAELDRIYRIAPVGIAELDGKELKVQRVNRRQAEFMGVPAADAMGRSILELPGCTPELRKMLEGALRGETIRSRRMEREDTSVPAGWRYWLISVEPALNDSEEVESISVVSYELEEMPRQGAKTGGGVTQIEGELTPTLDWMIGAH